MQIEHIDHPIEVYTITATSFPEGVLEAHQQLHQLTRQDKTRSYYGISFPAGKGKIMYMAAASIQKNDIDELKKLNKFIIQPGYYVKVTIKDFRKNIEQIGKTFTALLQHPQLKQNGHCLEKYPNDNDLICMVPIHYQP